MTPKLLKRWLEALRSKKYKQTTEGFLREKVDGGDKFCCLGVLCDLIDPSLWESSLAHEDEEDEGVKVYTYDGRNIGFPPMNIQTLIGDFEQSFDHNSANGSKTRYLVEWNDRGGSFDEIADWIEGNIDAKDD